SGGGSGSGGSLGSGSSTTSSALSARASSRAASGAGSASWTSGERPPHAASARPSITIRILIARSITRSLVAADAGQGGQADPQRGAQDGLLGRRARADQPLRQGRRQRASAGD